MYCCYSVSKSCPTLLRPHGLQHARFPCPSLSVGVCSNSGPLSQWHYPTMSSSATPFSFCFWSFLASGSLTISQLFASSSQSIGISPSNEYLGLISFRIVWFDLLAVQRTLKSSLQHHSSKASVLRHSAYFMVQLTHPYMTTGKTSIRTFVSKVMSLPFIFFPKL